MQTVGRKAQQRLKYLLCLGSQCTPCHNTTSPHLRKCISKGYSPLCNVQTVETRSLSATASSGSALKLPGRNRSTRTLQRQGTKTHLCIRGGRVIHAVPALVSVDTPSRFRFPPSASTCWRTNGAPFQFSTGMISGRMSARREHPSRFAQQISHFALETTLAPRFAK